jgi:glycosyltransferase involved in cell wall biosynthesis
VNSPPRIALFADTFYEPNGVGTLTRELADFAKARNFPFLVVRGSSRTCLVRDGSLEMLELERGPASFPVDKSLYFDPLMMRHRHFVVEQLNAFRPDLIHITGPGDLGFLGVWAAHNLRLPSVASWHTNLHEYLSRRLYRVLNLMPQGLRTEVSQAVERHTLRGLLRFYRTARFVLAPNQTYVDLLHTRNGKPAFLMPHGVDLRSYHPRMPVASNGKNGQHPFCIGYVGRLTTEKNVRIFPELERSLLSSGERNFQFLIVGAGGQQKWLEKHLQNALMPGVLRGADLAAAYSKMDVFVFPSRTDTFGLVILEAMASGVPVVLAPEVGQRVGIRNGVSGVLTEDFASGVQSLMHDPSLRESMGCEARHFAGNHSWNVVFEQLYDTYNEGLRVMTDRAGCPAFAQPQV